MRGRIGKQYLCYNIYVIIYEHGELHYMWFFFLLQKEEKKMDEKYYKCPRWVIALLKDLDEEIARCYWNKYQKKWVSPLQNTGNHYINDTFELKAYDWDSEMNQYNFKYNDLKISWYKHALRCPQSNKQIDADEFIFIYEECLKSIYRDFKEI